MKEERRNKKRQFCVFILLVILLMSFGYWKSWSEKNDLKNSKTTIGAVIGIEERFQRGYYITYEFEVNEQKYFENQKLTVNKELVKVGDRFEINYDENNPESSTLNFDKKISQY